MFICSELQNRVQRRSIVLVVGVEGMVRNEMLNFGLCSFTQQIVFIEPEGRLRELSQQHGFQLEDVQVMEG